MYVETQSLSPFLSLSLSLLSVYLSTYLSLFDTLSAPHLDLVFIFTYTMTLLFLAILFFSVFWSVFFFARQSFSDVRGRTSLGGGRMWQCREQAHHYLA